MSALSAILWLAIGVCAWFGLQGRRRATPPGPRPLPLIGNVFDITFQQLWLRATSWADQYGDVVYLNIFGQGILFLNTFDAAADLLEKRGPIYSDKPRMVMCAELCGCEKIIAFARYGDGFRRLRRLMQSALGAGSIPSYRPLLTAETYALLQHMVNSPERFMDHIRRFSGGQSLSIVYGYQVSAEDDPQLKLVEETLDLLGNHIALAGTGVWLVDIFPFLKHIPSWAPGAGFKRKAAAWKALIEHGADEPFQWVKTSMESGNATTCYCTALLGKQARAPEMADKEREADIKWTANAMVVASIDTFLTVLSHFVLAMAKYPAAMRKAQKEIDALTGGRRLPTPDDRPALPYVAALMRECLRWAAPVPLGLPHRLMEDDVYQNWSIPKGTLVFANIWRMSRDPSVFADPDEFIPERFLEAVEDPTMAKKRDPSSYVFGFGRRKCPGSHLADASLWLAMACMLATLDFGKATDASGAPTEPQAEYRSSTFRIPEPFPCKISPRSEHAIQLVQEAVSADA